MFLFDVSLVPLGPLPQVRADLRDALMEATLSALPHCADLHSGGTPDSSAWPAAPSASVRAYPRAGEGATLPLAPPGRASMEQKQMLQLLGQMCGRKLEIYSRQRRPP